MLKKLLPSALTAVLALASAGANAQTPTPNWCGTDAEQARYFAAHPGAREAQQAFDKRLTVLAEAEQNRAAYVTDVTIPVVVHIIHGGGSENISDLQINSAIEQLNLDYQKLNPDTASIIPLFRPIAASVGFRFRLARKDPNGACTTGITRHFAPNLLVDNGSGTIQALSNWDASRYMNIWVVRTITLGGNSGVGGYVSPPNTPTNPRDGFVVISRQFGTLGTSNLSSSRASTHEIGHYLSLSHPWGGNNNPGSGDCTGTDNVADTPPTDGITSCNLSYAPCGPIANVQNYMDYSYCFVMFTQGQRARMRALLNASRSVLFSASNLVATGTNDGYVAPNCPPVAAFAPAPGASTSVCVNTPVALRDYSYSFTAAGGPVTYAWSFPGGTPATATGQNVSVSYANAGFYAVTLTVTNSFGSTSSTLPNLIRVEGPTGGETAPMAQSFENPAFPLLFPVPSLRNYETFGATSAGVAATYRWQRLSGTAAADGQGYLVVGNRLYPPGAVTTLVTPNLNLAGVQGAAVLSFARAYALRTAASNDQLRISFSYDCGLNWSAPEIIDAAALSSKGPTPIDGFVPASAADWSTLSVPIPAQFQGSDLFKVRLQMVNGTPQGNNFYLDNLRVSGPLASQAGALARRGISVAPNPLTRETAVYLTLPAATSVQFTLTDLLGREVLRLPAHTYGAGPQTVPLQPAGHALRAGVYVVRIALGSETFSSKLVVE